MLFSLEFLLLLVFLLLLALAAAFESLLLRPAARAASTAALKAASWALIFLTSPGVGGGNGAPFGLLVAVP